MRMHWHSLKQHAIGFINYVRFFNTIVALRKFVTSLRSSINESVT